MFWWIRVWPFISSAVVQLTFILLVHSSTTGICYGCHCRSWWTHQLSDHQSRVETPSECVYEPHGGDMHQHVCVCVCAEAGVSRSAHQGLSHIKGAEVSGLYSLQDYVINSYFGLSQRDWMTDCCRDITETWMVYFPPQLFQIYWRIDVPCWYIHIIWYIHIL